VLLVERGARPAEFFPERYDPRVYALSPASQALLSALGAWPRIASGRVSPYTAMQIWESDPGQALCFSSFETGLQQLGWIVEDQLLADALWTELPQEGCLTGRSVETVAWGEAGARMQLSDGLCIDARLVVAADGAGSELRGMAGIDTIGWRYPQRAIVGHVRTDQAHGGRAFQRFLVSGPLALLPLADGRSSIVWTADETLAAELMALADDAFRARLGEACGNVLGAIIEATPRRALPLQLLHAAQYAAPSLVLIGDAAHAVHPLAGQGLNLGFADVTALVSVLGDSRAAGRDWGSPRALARYARARQAENLEMLALTDGLHRAFSRRLPGVRALLGLGLAGVNRAPPLKAWLARRATRVRS